MTRNRKISVLSTCFCVTAFVPVAFGRPNIVLFMPDDMEFVWPEAPTNQRIRNSVTPHMDGVRTNGIVFTNTYTAGVQCAPARFAVLTGRYASRGEYARGLGSPSADLRVTVTVPRTKITGNDEGLTVQAALQAEGYRTIMSGKWHLSRGRAAQQFSDYGAAWTEVERTGFDVDAGLYATNLDSTLPFSHNPEWNVALSREAMAASVADGDEFFLYFAPTYPHSPSLRDAFAMSNGIRQTPQGTLQSDPDHQMGFTRSEILANNAALSDRAFATKVVDLALGSLMARLDELQQTDNTLLICLMDHGMLDKPEITEGGIRIAMFAQYPNGIAPGSVMSSAVSNLDLFPTLMHAATGAPPAPAASGGTVRDGESWWAAATTVSAGTTATRPPRFTVSEDDMNRAVISSTGIKLIHRAPSSVELYDLAIDANEATNRAGDAAYIDALIELTAVLQCHDDNTGWNPPAEAHQTNCHTFTATTAAPTSASTNPPTVAPTAAPLAAPTLAPTASSSATLCCRDGSPVALVTIRGRVRATCANGRALASHCSP